jgi:hypothetical protein
MLYVTFTESLVKHNIIAFAGIESVGEAGITLLALQEPALKPAIKEVAGTL